MISGLRFWVFGFLFSLSLIASSQNKDSLVNILHNSQVDSVKVNICFQLADYFYYDNPDTAAYFYTKGIGLCVDPAMSALAFTQQMNLCLLYMDNSDFFNAKIVAEEALKRAELLKDSMLISRAHSNLGNIFYNIEMNEKALLHFIDAVNIYPIENSPIEAGKLFGRLGNLYLSMKLFDDAEQAYLKAVGFFKKANVQIGVIIATQNLGIIEKHRGNYQKAIEKFNEALKEYKSIGNQVGIAQCLANIGNIYVENREYDKALTNINKALKIFIDQNQIIDQIICYSELSEIYLKTNKPELASNYIKKAFQLNKSMPENYETKLTLFFLMQEIYASTGDLTNAYKYLNEYQSLNDSLINLDSQRRIDILQTQFQFEQREKDIELLTVENKLIETELKRKNIFQIFYLVTILLALLAITGLVFMFRIKKKANIALELKNAEIMQQKEEIETQRDEIEAQRDMVYSQKLDIETIHLKISQSIKYAQLIQESILPDPLILKDKVADHFVIYKPKDIVSGDFYWWANVENNTVITAADCTGHGVPGAFMSMLGISFLREIVMKEYISHPGVILRKLRKEIVRSLKQKNELGATRDGMDMALISINQDTNVVQFSGAYNSIYIITKQIPEEKNSALKVYPYDVSGFKMLELKPDKMPIAIYFKMDPFTNHEIQLQKGDQIYMFSDGFIDQFGGPENKRFMNGPFRELLLKNASKSMITQKKHIETAFKTWKGNGEQIDDILVMGVKI